MNFAHFQSLTNFSQSFRLDKPNKNEKVLDSLPTEDDKEVDDDTLSSELESFVSLTEDASDLSKLHQGDFLFQFYLLKLEKRIAIIRKTFEEGPWSGTESIKLIEKQDIGIIVILRNLISIAETFIEIFDGNARVLVMNTTRLNNMIYLLLYCDNLEINCLCMKFVSLILQNQDLKRLENGRFLQLYYTFFVTVWRQRYPYIAEIFKNEKFYKDTGSKPIGNDVQGDQAIYEHPETPYFKLDVVSVKKEYSDFFSSYYQTQQLLAKDNIQPITSITPLFVNVMLSLRLAKNFAAIKNRALIAAIQCFSLAGLKEFEGGSEDLKKWNLSKDQRIIYAMRSFPYPDYQLDMISCISKARENDNNNSVFFIVDEDFTLEPEIRFLEEFCSKNINEEGSAFSEAAKFEDYVKTFQHLSYLYRVLKKDVLTKLGNKNIPNAAKLEQDCYDIIDQIVKFLKLVISRLTQELNQSSGLQLRMILQLFRSQQSFILTNGDILNSEVQPVIDELKIFYKAASEWHLQDQRCPANVFCFLEFCSNNALLKSGGFFADELTSMLHEKELFDNCYIGFKHEQEPWRKAGSSIIFAHCGIFAQGFLQSGDETRFVQVVEVVSVHLKTSNRQLQPFPAAVRVLNFFIKQYGDNINHVKLVDTVNYSRFCYAYLSSISDQTQEEMDERAKKLLLSSKNNTTPLLTDSSPCIDDSYVKYMNSFVGYFQKYLDEKIAIIKEDQEFENAVIRRFPKYQTNPFIRSFIESLLATNAFRATQFQLSFYQNFLILLSKTQVKLTEKDTRHLIEQSLELVHNCSIDLTLILSSLLQSSALRLNGIIVIDHSEEISIAHIFLDLFVSILEASSSSLTFFPSVGIAKDWSLSYNGQLRISDNAMILMANFDEQVQVSLKIAKQLSQLYALFKTQIEFIKKDAPMHLSNQSLNAFIAKAKQILPSLIASTLVSKVKFYLGKMEAHYEYCFSRNNQNKVLRQAVLAYVQNALKKPSINPNKVDSQMYAISKMFLGDIDALQTTNKGLEKQIVGLPQQLLKLTYWDLPNRTLVHEFYSLVSTKILQNSFSGNINTANIREALTDLAVNIVAEQEIRKSLNFKSMNSPFDQSEYYRKLTDLSAGIASAFRKFKIGLELFQPPQDDSSLTRESWMKHQFYILSMVFLKSWFNVFQAAGSLSFTSTRKESLTVEQMLMGGGSQNESETPIEKFPEMLKVLIVDNKNMVKNSAAKEQFMQFLINCLNLRHFAFNNMYKGSMQLELANPYVLDGATPAARIFVGQYIARIFGEISRTGIALTSEECSTIADLIPLLQQKDDRSNIAVIMAQVQLLTIELFKDYDCEFKATNFPATDLFVAMKIPRSPELYPEGLKAFLESLRREISNTPQVNKAALIGTLVFVIIDVINKCESWVVKYSTYDRQSVIEFFILMFQIYLENLTISPQMMKQAVNNFSNMMKMLNVWLSQLNIYIKEAVKISADYLPKKIFTDLLRNCKLMFNKLIDFLESAAFKDFSKQSKVFTPSTILRNLLILTSFCLGKLKYEEVSLDEELEQITRVLFRFCAVSYEDNLQERLNGSKNTNELWLPLIRCFESIFLFQRESFLKSCIEIRLRNALYIPAQKRFTKYLKLSDFAGKQIIQRDMLEHGRCLRQVISILFEGIRGNEQQIEENDDEWEQEAEILPELIPDEDGEVVAKEGGEDVEGEKQENLEGEVGEVGDVKIADEEGDQAKEKPKLNEEEQENDDKQVNQENGDPEKHEGEEREQGNEERQEEHEVGDDQHFQEDLTTQQVEGAITMQAEDQKHQQNTEKPIHMELSHEQQQEHSQFVEETKRIVFKFHKSLALVSSKIVKLNNLQRTIVDGLLNLLESRINDTYNQAKEKQATSSTANFKIFYVEYPFIFRSLQMLIQKYPLVIPYILEHKIVIPEFAIFKKANVVSFLDFLIVAGTITEFTSNSLLQSILDTNYTYFEKKKKQSDGEEGGEGEEEPPENIPPPVEEIDEAGVATAGGIKHPIKKKPKLTPIIGSSSYYLDTIIERIISWTKKIVETKNFINIEGCHTILYGILANFKFLAQNYALNFRSEQFKKMLAVITLLIKRAASQTDLFKLISVAAFDIAALCLEQLPRKLLEDRHIYADQKQTQQYINYYVNRFGVSYFEKDKGLELERASMFNSLDIFATISSNMKQGNAEILQCRYQLETTGPFKETEESAGKQGLNSSRASRNVSGEQLSAEEKGFEGLFHKLNVIQSSDEMAYEHHHQSLSQGLQGLYDYYCKYPTIFAKREHTATFIYSLSHLYAVLRRQTEFEVQDNNLLETIYSQRPQSLNQFELIDQIIFKSLDQQQHQALYSFATQHDNSIPPIQGQKFNGVKSQDTPRITVLQEAFQPSAFSADNNMHRMQVPGVYESSTHEAQQLSGNQYFSNSNSGNLLFLQRAIRSTQEAAHSFTERNSLSRTTAGTNSKSIHSNTGRTYDSHVSVFDVTTMGYPQNALEIYEIDESVFAAASIIHKAELLRQGKQKQISAMKLRFAVEREKDILQKFLQKINAQINTENNNNNNHEMMNVLLKFKEDGSLQHDDELQSLPIDSQGRKRVIIPEIPNSLRVFIQQNMIDFFNGLPPKDQRMNALSWDKDILDMMPSVVRLQVDSIKEEYQDAMRELEEDADNQDAFEEAFKASCAPTDIQTLEYEAKKEGIVSSGILFSGMQKIPSLDRVLKHKNLLLEMIPTFDDEFLLKLFESLHIYTDKSTNESPAAALKLLSVVCTNPYNAFRIIDLFSFLLFVFPRRGKITDPLNQKGLNLLVEAPVLLLDKSASFQAEVDGKYWKLANYVGLINQLFAANKNVGLFILQDYPLNVLEECKMQVGRSQEQQRTASVPVFFRSFDQIKDIKLPNLLKGQKEGLSLNSLVISAYKWIQSDRNIQPSVLSYNGPQSSLQTLSAPFQKFTKEFYERVEYVGENKAFFDNKYPVFIRPLKEANIEELLDNFGNIASKNLEEHKRLAMSDSFIGVKDKCKQLSFFTDFSKTYLRVFVKKMHPELRRIKAAFIHKQAQIKQQQNLDELNGNGVGLSDILGYHDFLSQFKAFFQEDMQTFKKSLKDIIELYKSAEKQELKQLLREFPKREADEGEEAAHQWFESEKAKIISKLTTYLRNTYLVEDPSIFNFCLDLLQFIVQSINFAWSLEEFIIPSYSIFDYPLKSLLSLCEFLYPEEIQRIASPSQQDSLEEKTESPEDSQKSILFDLMSKQSDQILQDVNAGQSMSKTMGLLNASQPMKQFQGTTLPQLKDLILKNLGKLIQYLINSYDVKSKKRWVELSNIIAVDVKSSRRLDAEKKIAQAAAFAKFVAKKKIKLPERKMLITCQRDQTWYSSLGDLMNYSPEQVILSKFDVVFEGEAGIDAGGLTREWIVLAINDVLDPAKGLFKLSSNNVTLQPSPHSFLVPNHLTHFRYAGRLIAKGLIEKLDFEVDFTKSFLKHILHQTLFISDLEDIDPEEANSLNWVLENDVTDLSLTFSIHRDVLQSTYVVDLIPNGRNIEVTQENKKDYVKAICNFKMTEEIKGPIQSFLHGFYEILPLRSLQYLSEQELGLILSGVKKIDRKEIRILELQTNLNLHKTKKLTIVEDMRKYTRYHRYTAESQVIQWFFEVMEEYDEDQRSLFLFFVTGSFKVPFGGFKNLSLEIAKVDNKEKLPVAHTCTKSLDLPEYDSKEILKEKLTLSIQEGKQGFHIA